MKKIVNNFELIVITLTIIMNEGFFYLLGIKETTIIKNLSYIIAILVFYILILAYKKKWNIFNFKYEILALVILIFISPFNTSSIYGQPVYIGYKLILCYSMYLNYLFFSYFLNKSDENKKNFDRVLILISILGGILYILQYYLYPKIILGGLDYRLNFRFDKPRLYVATMLFSLSFFYSFTKLIFKEKEKLLSKNLYSIACIVNLVVLVMIVKTRTIVAAIALCIVFLVFMKIKNSSFLKSIIFIACFVPIIIFSLNSSTVQNMLQLTQSNDISLSARVSEIEFYKQQIKESPIIGRGEVDKILLASVDGSAYKMYLDDLGLMGFVVKYGFIGGIILLFIVFKVINICRKSTVFKSDKYFIVIMSIFIVITSVFIPYLDFPDSIIYISIILAYTDNLKLKEAR